MQVSYLGVRLQLTAHHLQSGEQTVFINQSLMDKQSLFTFIPLHVHQTDKYNHLFVFLIMVYRRTCCIV